MASLAYKSSLRLSPAPRHFSPLASYRSHNLHFKRTYASAPTPNKNMSAPATEFLDAVASRRTIYTLSKDSTISDARVEEIVKHAVKHVPSSFNSQSSRTVILFAAHHDKLWDITKEILKTIVPAEAFPATEARINGFRNAHGTVLFFEDKDDVKAMQDKFPTYQDRFPIWAQHTSGMLQFVVWAALEKEGLGANLQHYAPLIDERVRSEWNVPVTWELVAQMPFGKPTAPAGEKQFKPLDERVKVFH
ncbi:Nitroreductase-like protein [Fimicolochytrium jonesii]|uniref:Nitroreductase-like protein n=1 Tax=Fimicolochytrium jonesii TaxID=1396493 RepID=UPI0022FE600C|nr:Nitroreductase-like protein [Fimicolochytrium jonesii]KAI8827236.1 Nitroreductase-like protein [Fimicolochytrium jonesii]